ncbi:nuclease SbcCD subunit C [Paenibacillus sp. J23TS9]|uniref:SbcC/MukB-like Walker B domain-containing protein n=1 Tax=Paenibacillus sp. J23TS9 TaxID=2807193 RepID=UPI001B17CA3A|nr:SbcC/MukB-like Walker B domain-containing protein [Paenibacillus sp. J23TS9]GIP25113.1 nuclease SbcCD subunit C [Paenibacillus sp. J23TS9]
MKPITLKLSGLQSYREMQQINFEDLCDMGLFGIFGPTGSGKSTLLDAMTLALYGKVDRAVNGTQGIMNHSEDTLFVSFCFELTSAEGKHRFRVERRFKRTSELSVSNTVSRFIEVNDEGENVLADKLAEVTRCVEDKIGLKMDDFTRAVVLPQGKFAEFLSLKGSERRQMLQRLFHLEQYGDQLGIKLSRRVKENEGALKAVEAEQQGLGEAGQEALEMTEKQLHDAALHAEAIRTKLQAITLEAEVKGKIRERQLEKNRKQVQLDQLLASENEMLLLEKRLENSAASSMILPSLILWRENGQEQKLKESERAVLQTAAAHAEQAAADASASDDAAQGALTAGEPKLLQRQEQLEQAVLLQKERDGIQSLYEELGTQQKEAASRMNELQQSLAKEQELLSRGAQKQSELQEKLNGLEITSKERDMLQKALQLRQMLRSAEEGKSKAQRELEQQQEKLASAQKKHEQSVSEHHRLQDQEKQLIFKVSACLTQAEEQAKLAERALLSLEKDEQQLHEELKQQQLQRLSLSLAAELHEGQPCPVCGSLEHPVPAHSDAAESGMHEDMIRQLQGYRSRLQDIKYASRQMYHECSSLCEGGTATSAEPMALDHSAASAEPTQAASKADAFSTVIWEERTRGLEYAQREFSGELANLKRESLELRDQREALRQQAIKHAAETEAGSSVLEQLKNRLEQLAEEVAQLQEKWAKELPDLLMEEVETRWSQMQQKDQDAEDVKERLRRSIPFLDEKKNTVQSMERSLTESEKHLIQLDAQLRGKQELLKEKQERLYAWIGDNRAEALLEACALELKALRETAAKAKQLRLSAEQAKYESAKAYAMACQAAESAAAHYEASGKRWEKLLSASPFANEAEVEAAHVQPQEAEQLAARVREHRDRERDLRAAIRHFEEQLLGSSLTEEHWLHVTQELAAFRQADEEALQAKARAERDLEDIKKRHVRWTELEKLRLVRQQEAEKLAKLQSCLRGNAFVEYIAEEQLMQVSQSASQRLRFLTKQRYALEVDSGGGFLIRDDANGGVRRPVSTLSGGETFLTSLSLALALSAQIQLRGQYPLQFFFLDEGFGTLDPDLLETVISSLEKLHNDHLSVGVISHVPELRARLPRKLVVLPADQAGGGSKITVEEM